MKPFFPVMLCGLLALSATLARAQAPTPSYRKAKAASPNATAQLPFFTLSTSPTVSDQAGSSGYFSASFYQAEAPPPSSPQGAPPAPPTPAIRLSPEEKRNYVVVTATITVPTTIIVPNTLQVNAQRIRYTLNANGQKISILMGGSEIIPLVLVTQSAQGKPVDNGNNTTTYTYRTHDLQDEEASPRRKGGELDWQIHNKLGRWRLEVTDYPSNAVEFKINKRGQLTNYALDWADFYAYKRSHATTQAELDKWSTIIHPNKLFHHCFSFASEVYSRHNLVIAPTNTGMPAAATADDEGPGSLRFFWTNEQNPTAVTDPGHVGIIGPNTALGYGTRIDNNGKPTRETRTYFWDFERGTYDFRDDVFYGPLWRPKDEGVGSAYFDESQDPQRKPQSRTLPASRGGTKPNSPLAKSLLEELDEE